MESNNQNLSIFYFGINKLYCVLAEFGKHWISEKQTWVCRHLKEEAKADVCEGVLDISSFLRLDYPQVFRGFFRWCQW